MAVANSQKSSLVLERRFWNEAPSTEGPEGLKQRFLLSEKNHHMSSVFGDVQYEESEYVFFRNTGIDFLPRPHLKARMTQLYVEQDKSLKEIMSTVERDYGFTAT